MPRHLYYELNFFPSQKRFRRFRRVGGAPSGSTVGRMACHRRRPLPPLLLLRCRAARPTAVRAEETSGFESVPCCLTDVLEAVGPEVDAAEVAGDDYEDVKDVENLQQVRDPPPGRRLAVVVVVFWAGQESGQ
jgi:hypothetical protein